MLIEERKPDDAPFHSNIHGSEEHLSEGGAVVNDENNSFLDRNRGTEPHLMPQSDPHQPQRLLQELQEERKKRKQDQEEVARHRNESLSSEQQQNIQNEAQENIENPHQQQLFDAYRQRSQRLPMAQQQSASDQQDAGAVPLQNQEKSNHQSLLQPQQQERRVAVLKRLILSQLTPDEVLQFNSLSSKTMLYLADKMAANIPVDEIVVEIRSFIQNIPQDRASAIKKKEEMMRTELQQVIPYQRQSISFMSAHELAELFYAKTPPPIIAQCECQWKEWEERFPPQQEVRQENRGEQASNVSQWFSL